MCFDTSTLDFWVAKPVCLPKCGWTSCTINTLRRELFTRGELSCTHNLSKLNWSKLIAIEYVQSSKIQYYLLWSVFSFNWIVSLFFQKIREKKITANVKCLLYFLPHSAKIPKQYVSLRVQPHPRLPLLTFTPLPCCLPNLRFYLPSPGGVRWLTRGKRGKLRGGLKERGVGVGLKGGLNIEGRGKEGKTDLNWEKEM